MASRSERDRDPELSREEERALYSRQTWRGGGEFGIGQFEQPQFRRGRDEDADDTPVRGRGWLSRHRDEHEGSRRSWVDRILGRGRDEGEDESRWRGWLGRSRHEHDDREDRRQLRRFGYDLRDVEDDNFDRSRLGWREREMRTREMRTRERDEHERDLWARYRDDRQLRREWETARERDARVGFHGSRDADEQAGWMQAARDLRRERELDHDERARRERELDRDQRMRARGPRDEQLRGRDIRRASWREDDEHVRPGERSWSAGRRRELGDYRVPRPAGEPRGGMRARFDRMREERERAADEEHHRRYAGDESGARWRRPARLERGVLGEEDYDNRRRFGSPQAREEHGPFTEDEDYRHHHSGPQAREHRGRRADQDDYSRYIRDDDERRTRDRRDPSSRRHS